MRLSLNYPMRGKFSTFTVLAPFSVPIASGIGLPKLFAAGRHVTVFGHESEPDGFVAQQFVIAVAHVHEAVTKPLAEERQHGHFS